jgi:hypothetical protein
LYVLKVIFFKYPGGYKIGSPPITANRLVAYEMPQSKKDLMNGCLKCNIRLLVNEEV